MLIFIYVISTLSWANVIYLETVNRVTVKKIFDHSLLGSSSVDSLAVVGLALLFGGLSSRSLIVRTLLAAVFVACIASVAVGLAEAVKIAALFTFPVLAAMLGAAFLSNRRSGGNTRRWISALSMDARRVAVALLLVISILEVASLARWIAYPGFPDKIYGDESWRFAELESALFHSFGVLSPQILVLTSFAFLYRQQVLSSLDRLTRRKSPPLGDEEKVLENKTSWKWDDKSRKAESESVDVTSATTVIHEPASVSVRSIFLSHRTLLAIALATSVLIAIYPHLPGVNPLGTGISTDEKFYMNWLSQIRSNAGQGLDAIIHSTFQIAHGDRPLSLLALIALANISGSADLTIARFLPIGLAPALVISVFMLLRFVPAKNVENRNTRAAIVALIAALSPQVVVGIYAGFLANWLALIPALFAILFMIRGWESADLKKTSIYAGGLFGTLVLVLLFHVYTWGHLIVVMGLFLGGSYLLLRKSTTNSNLKVILLAVSLAASIAVDTGKSTYFDVPAGLQRDTFVAGNALSLENFESRWETLYSTLQVYIGGFLSNPVLFALAFIWIFQSSYKTSLDRFLLMMLFLLALPVLFGNLPLQVRMIFNTLFYIPAALVVYNIKQKEGNRVFLVALVAVLLVMANYALRAMANLYLVLPEDFELEKAILLS